MRNEIVGEEITPFEYCLGTKIIHFIQIITC